MITSDQDYIALTGGSITLAIVFGDNPGTNWTSYMGTFFVKIRSDL